MNVSRSPRLWKAEIIIIKQWSAHPRKILGLLLKQAFGSSALVH